MKIELTEDEVYLIRVGLKHIEDDLSKKWEVSTLAFEATPPLLRNMQGIKLNIQALEEKLTDRGSER